MPSTPVHHTGSSTHRQRPGPGGAAMKKFLSTIISIVSALALTTLVPGVSAQDSSRVPKIPPRPAKGEMSFFITSVGMGDGANLGGLAGADAHCQKLAAASGQPGADKRTWRAYLSTQAAPGIPAVNARDRIGPGPWYNARGVRIAVNNADLHGDTIELARK